MALRKVKQLEPTQDYGFKIPLQTEQEAIQDRNEEPSMNPHNSISSENLNENFESVSKANFLKSSAMDRIIYFDNDSVSMQRTAKIAEGVYDFCIVEITVRENVETQYGLKDQYLITFSLYDESTEQFTKLSMPYNISSNQQSALMIFLGAFKDVFKGKKITIRHLIGMIGQARITHVISEDGNVFEKVEIVGVDNPNT